MKKFRVKLTMHFEGKPDTIIFIGKCTIDAKGYIKGFLKNYNEDKAKFKKSYIIGLKDEHGNISLVQVWARVNGDFKFPTSPIVYDIKAPSKDGKWERIDRIHDYEYSLWKLGRPGFENFYFSGTVSIDLKEIPEYPLDEKENEIISNIMEVKALRIRNMLELDGETFNDMKKEMSQIA